MYESVVFVRWFMVRKLVPDANTIVISLASPNDPKHVAIGWRDVLRLEFHDVCEEVLGVPVETIPDADSEGHLVHECNGLIVRLPDANHAKAIADFLTKHEGGCCDFVRVLVHCDQGKSRSAAVAQFVADKYNVLILNANPEWQDRVSMSDTSRANPRLLRLLNKQEGCKP